MTKVNDLMEMLSKYPPEANVVIWSEPESEYCDVGLEPWEQAGERVIQVVAT